MNHITSNISPMDTGRTAVLIVCLYLLNLQLFCSYELFERSNQIPTGPQKIETGETWSVFNLFNPEYDHSLSKSTIWLTRIVVLYGSIKRQSLKRAFVFANSAWSGMIWIVLFIILLALWSLYCSADWIGMLTTTSATIPCNSVLLYWIFML